MDYDYIPYRPSNYYSTPRYYSTYVPSCLVRDRYNSAYRFYRPLHISNATYSKARANLPYTIPDDSIPISGMLSPQEPESVRYDYTYGSDFNSATQDIREKADKLLRDIQSPSIRKLRAHSLEPYFNKDLDYNAVRRIVNRTRQTSNEPGGVRSIQYSF